MPEMTPPQPAGPAAGRCFVWPVTGMAALFAAVLTGGPTVAQDGPGMSNYGLPGHIEMPSAFAMRDGTLAFTLSQTAYGVRRGTMSFQIAPRLTGSFRYSFLRDWQPDGTSLYDRSFDLRFQLATEDPGGWRPAVAVGLQDFGGTGVFSSEYLVASRHFGPDISASVGLGWGRLGSHGGFRNPLSLFSDGFESRPGFAGMEETGQVGFDRFFRGDAAVFLAADWQVTAQMRLSLEYSSDGMKEEVARSGFRHRSPLNLGMEYRFASGGTAQLSLLSGSALVLGYTHFLNPRRQATPSGREPGPPPVLKGRPIPLRERESENFATLERALAQQGVALGGIEVAGDTAIVAISNLRWPAAAQAWGRTARVLSAELPSGVRIFRIRTHVRGMAMTEVVVTRSDLEELEYAPDGAWQVFVRAGISDAATLRETGAPDPRFDPGRKLSFRLLPYAEPSFFDPDSPLRLDFGAELGVEWMPMQGFFLSGAIRQKIAGNLDGSTRASDSVLPHVRSDAWLYDKAAGPTIRYLVAEHFGRPAQDFYSRISFGLFEPMFGGASAELLWAPPDRRLALGAEVNWVRQRDLDGGFGFQDYSVATGHMSAYYDFGGGYFGQLDVGRYLAGDWGSTLTLNRRFGNGFEIGAFFTLTDAGFERFGEGSFDKGITFRIPVSLLTGQPQRDEAGLTIRPILRDGGARLSTPHRLYDLTREERAAAAGERWSRFWR